MVIVSKITEKEVLETIETLEIRVDELIQKCSQLNIENQSLKENNNKLSETHKSVLEKKNLATPFVRLASNMWVLIRTLLRAEST